MVQALGRAAFVPDGTPRSEWPHVLDDVVAAAEAESAPSKPPPRIDPSTPISELLICTRTITMSRAGGCGKGTIVTRKDPRVVLTPELFRPLVDHLGE